MEDPPRPLVYADGNLPIADHGLIGDGRSAALIGRDGTVCWLCAPRFDSPPIFCGLLDPVRGGAFQLKLTQLERSRQRYLGDTGVLVTELHTATGILEVTDALTLRSGTDLATSASAGRGELLRKLQVRHGEIEVELVVDPRGEVEASPDWDGFRLRSPAWPELTLQLGVTVPLSGRRTRLQLTTGDPVYAWLTWADPGGWPPPPQRLSATVADWERWARHISFHGTHPAMVRRSAITLKLLDYAQNGALVAAPTSSLPEWISGERNWDYRYTWVRDAAFSVYAMRRIGLDAEADSFLSWVLQAVERDGEPRVLYNLDGHLPPPEHTDPELSGYRGSSPVRWGNGAAEQSQHDVYGEILDCAYQWARNGGKIDLAMWQWLGRLAELARTHWNQPDHGIWEMRTTGRRFTYSVALCQVALDRAARLAHQLDLPGDRDGWAATAAKIRQALLSQAWDPETSAIAECLADGAAEPRALDASVLALPLRRFIPPDHPKMRSTTRAVVDRLGAGDGLLYRYLPSESPDGMAGQEGAFLLCSFWLVDNLAGQGHLDQAGELFDSLCARANPLGLLPEQIDPGTGAFLGNFPQALSHVGVISSAVNLARAGVTQ